MVAMRHASQRGAILALTARAQNNELVGRQIGGVFFFHRRRKICQISGCPRCIVNPVHAPTGQANISPIVGRRLCNARQAGNVGGKCCDHNPPRAFGNHFVQGGGDIGFRARTTF